MLWSRGSRTLCLKEMRIGSGQFSDSYICCGCGFWFLWCSLARILMHLCGCSSPFFAAITLTAKTMFPLQATTSDTYSVVYIMLLAIRIQCVNLYSQSKAYFPHFFRHIFSKLTPFPGNFVTLDCRISRGVWGWRGSECDCVWVWFAIFVCVQDCCLCWVSTVSLQNACFERIFQRIVNNPVCISLLAAEWWRLKVLVKK